MAEPVLSGIASLIIPGLGQILNKRYLRGIILLIALGAIVVILLPILTTVGGIRLFMIVTGIYAIAVAADAYKIAEASTPER